MARLCTLHGRLVALKQDASHLHYRVLWPDKVVKVEGPEAPSTLQVDDTEALLRHYLSLKVDLGALYAKWSQVDPNFRKHAPQFTGVRILNQDAWETLISFICSSNNNISRISQMVRPRDDTVMDRAHTCLGSQTLFHIRPLNRPCWGRSVP